MTRWPSRKGLRAFGSTAAVAFFAMWAAPSAIASPVLRVSADGLARAAEDRLLPPAAGTSLPEIPKGTRIARARRSGAIARAADLDAADQETYTAALDAARVSRDALPLGSPRDELAAIIANAEALDASGQLTASRLNATVITLDRNRQFWELNAPPLAGTRVTFTGSPVILEYYPGQGLQIQPLANFGKANGHWSYCASKRDSTCTSLRRLLDAMIDLAAERESFTAWEYSFAFEGGTPPWISSMAQGTGIQALSRAYQLTGETRYKDAAAAALGAFETPPPVGVARPGSNGTAGTHYVMYSYAPDLEIFNGFFQSLVGLDDYRDITGDARGTTLFRAGHPNARALTPLSDTGSWSRYSVGGPDSTREYHVLLRDILRNLCKRIGTPVYCDTATRFSQYLVARPA